MNIEHKLELIQQMHREQEENERYIYDNLKQKIYRKGLYDPDLYSYGYDSCYRMDFTGKETQISWFASFRFRLLVAVLLFLCFFVMDKKEINYGGIDSIEIVESIDENFSLKDSMFERAWNRYLTK